VRIRFLHTEGFRLSAIYAGIFALSMVVLGGFVLLSTERTFRDQIVQYSGADIAAIRNGYVNEGIPEAKEVMSQLMAASIASDFFLLQQHGKVIAGNLPSMTPQIGTVELPASPATQKREVLGVGAFLAPGLYVYSGSNLKRVHHAQYEIRRVLQWLFAVALLLAMLGGALVSRSFLHRADAIARACRAIMDGDMKTRIAVRGTRDELDRLADTINEMLDRIAALMENLRQVTNDIAHDLRTPVTHLRHRLERARADCITPEDYRAALETAIGSADEILALFAALLRIAQIEGGARRAGFAQVDMGALLLQLRDILSPVAEDAGHALQADCGTGVFIRGDSELLVQLFHNLVENAILHTPPGTRITLDVAAEDARIVARVADDGPGVPRAEHGKIFQRFYRREASRTESGYGLGLALASAIADLHGGGIAIAPQDRPGLCVEVWFPLSSDLPTDG
jgi:signal transduction histidine kinase